MRKHTCSPIYQKTADMDGTLLPYMHTYIHIYIHKHTCSPIYQKTADVDGTLLPYMHTYIHTYIHTQAHMLTNIPKDGRRGWYAIAVALHSNCDVFLTTFCHARRTCDAVNRLRITCWFTCAHENKITIYKAFVCKYVWIYVCFGAPPVSNWVDTMQECSEQRCKHH